MDFEIEGLEFFLDCCSNNSQGNFSIHEESTDICSLHHLENDQTYHQAMHDAEKINYHMICYKIKYKSTNTIHKMMRILIFGILGKLLASKR